MRFQGSGFTVEVVDGAIDASAYVFSYPEIGPMPPNIVLRFEIGERIDMQQRHTELMETIETRFPDPTVRGDSNILQRGDWQYFTYVLEFGEPEYRIVLKEMHIKIMQPKPMVYVLSGSDQVDNFSRFEPVYDAFVRSFEPNDLQRI